MALPRGLRRFNRSVTNRVATVAAGRMPGFAIVEHKGRNSGRLYRTPVNVFETPGGYRFALTYGKDTDWVKNILAEGGCVIETKGRTVTLTDPRFGEDAEASWAPPGVRQVLATVGAPYYLDVRVASR